MINSSPTPQTKTKPISVIAFIWHNTKKEKTLLFLAFLTSLVGIATNFLTPQVIRFTVDSILGDEPAPAFTQKLLNIFGVDGSAISSLICCAVFVAILALLTGIFSFFSRISIAASTETFAKNLRDKLYRHIQHLPFKWHVDNKTGDTIQRCTSDLDVVRNFVANQLLEVIRTSMLIGVALVLMFSMNITLSLIALAFIPVIIGYSFIYYKLVGNRFLEADEAEGALTVAVQENLTGVRVVRAFGREKHELDNFDKHNNFFASLWLKLGRVLSMHWAVGDLSTGLQIITIVVAGSVLAAGGTLSLGEFLVFVSYTQTLAWPIRALGRTLSEMSKTGVSAARLQEILNAETEPEEPAASSPPLNTDIHFENVSFKYENQPVLKNLSFTIPAGSTFGIMGSTGSGKSTITYLLNRLYELPEGSGTIRFGNVDIRDINRQYLRKNVGLVLQEPFLFSKTIEENIAITAPGPSSKERVRHAAGMASVHHAIKEFSNGYETVVGERGVTLSGGQKQRVAIARTLMQKSPVMVFDDSMSAVDLETDAHIRKALREQTANTTLVLISHRINTLMAADTIMVLEDGMLADIGSHSQLITRDGAYRRIYDMQSEAAAGNVQLESPRKPTRQNKQNRTRGQKETSFAQQRHKSAKRSS